MLTATLFWSLFSDRFTRNLFETIVKERRINYRDLRQSIDLDEEDTSERLERLKEAKLIEAKSAPVKDFETYYVTANGLSVERELRRQDVNLSTPDGTVKVASP